MKKNILIIGYGNIASRLHAILCKDSYKIYGMSRTRNRGLENHIEWNWLYKDLPNLECNHFESIIFIPKPSSRSLTGYQEGFLKSSENTFNFIEASKKIVYKKFITISSTGAYGRTTSQESYLDESSNIVPMFTEENPYPGHDITDCQQVIRHYEQNQTKRYGNKLILLRFSGLYILEPISKNHLHRQNAAKIIKFFIENDFDFSSPEIFNCTEDASLFCDGIKSSYGNISNEKIKELGFIFD